TGDSGREPPASNHNLRLNFQKATAPPRGVCSPSDAAAKYWALKSPVPLCLPACKLGSKENPATGASRGFLAGRRQGECSYRHFLMLIQFVRAETVPTRSAVILRGEKQYAAAGLMLRSHIFAQAFEPASHCCGAVRMLEARRHPARS